jgi:hypothetical protein
MLLAMAGPALAQQSPGSAPSYPVVQSPTAVDRSHVWAPPSGDFVDRMNRGDRSPDRVARAERLAALANSGECQSAYGIALEEHDVEIAANLARACDLPAPDARTVRRISHRR